jgi:hypothetical protein
VARATAASALELALAVLARAQARGDETATRKALERLGAELDGNGVDGDLAAAARGLAWAEPAPTADEVRRIAERVRGEAGT